ncbi:hypothetical protein HSB1_08150 [Halogranum salarium B-1]|uniref:Uncharacterized protein n=1 Tax=Halogranum salarium B-1 TaxID=1210908 RepID=J3EY70_9EURY|nr:hypothetical protein HSB1_08150 [Halogranum salarium B-1]
MKRLTRSVVRDGKAVSSSRESKALSNDNEPRDPRARGLC